MSTQLLSVTIHYFALLREQRGTDSETRNIHGTTPRALYQELAASYNFTLPVDNIGVAVNDEFVALDCVLKDGDSVTFIPPVAGG